MNAKIGFKRQVTATPGFHSLFDMSHQKMRLFPGVPDNPENDTGIEKHSADAMHYAMKSPMHAIPAKDEEAQ